MARLFHTVVPHQLVIDGDDCSIMSTAGSIERGYSAAVPAREGVRREGGTEYGVGPRVVRQRDHPVQPRPADPLQPRPA